MVHKPLGQRSHTPGAQKVYGTGASLRGRFSRDYVYEGWTIEQLTPNAISAIPFRRAILVLLDRWATHGTPPPPSLLPKTADGTLVTAEEALAR